MAINKVKIHPAIGVARLGNSPNEFFIGPEHPWERPDPPGGFKDNMCRVKRQAARFRLYAYDSNGTITELTSANADITWTVHLVNKKAVPRNTEAAADMTIDPGAKMITGPNQQKIFDNGKIKFSGASAVTVPLGEIRSDNNNHLLVLGGFGKSASPTNQSLGQFYSNVGWYDDISDGPVTATVKLHSNGQTFTADGAWVIVGPPKFAPHLDNVITLYDKLFQMAVGNGWLTAPVTPSYTNDIYPILQRARDAKWLVYTGGAHTWPDPVYGDSLRLAIFNRLKNPSGGGSNMPNLNSASLTQTQYDIMGKWKDNNFTRDWVAPPSVPATITPHGLDQAALENCVGAAFYPGIEAGGITAAPIIDPTKYIGSSDPIRLNHAAVSAGDMSMYMALPWQADFYACGSNWWPVPRPNMVRPQGTTSSVAWDRDIGSYDEMVTKWNTLGFVVKQANEYVEVDRCDTTFILLLTPHLNFQDVPQGPMGMSRKTALAVSFEVKSTGGPVVLEISPAERPTNPRVTLNSNTVSVGPTSGDNIAIARLWVIYETGAANEMISDQLTVRHLASGASWVITITANTVPRKTAAAALVLDRSYSMTEDRGDGLSKYQSLKEAASIFIDVMVEGDGLGLVRFNQDGQKLSDITTLGPAGDPFDTARSNAKDIINGTDLTPAGDTSIGDGIFEGRQILNAATTPYDVKSLVVLTDGKENRSRYIADVSAQINETTYGIGLGKPENISVPALQTISGNNGGYLLVTGPIGTDNRFILQKYFLQILAGISNAEIVLDPNGQLVPGHEQAVPFLLTEADAGADIILLTPYPTAVDFRIQTPTGQIIEPWRAMNEPDMLFVLSSGISYYRLVLPTELIPGRLDHGGTWRALLTIGRPRLKPSQKEDIPRQQFNTNQERRTASQAGRAGNDNAKSFMSEFGISSYNRQQRTLPYSLVVHSYSNLSMRAHLHQSGFEPGAKIHLVATVSESGIPVLTGTHIWAEVTRPGGLMNTVQLTRNAAGEYNASFDTSVSGVYQCRIRASGRSRSGYPYTREQTLTAAVWDGGNRDADPTQQGGGPLVDWLQQHDEKLCGILRCILSQGGVITPKLEKKLKEDGLDIDKLRKCLAGYCK